MSTNTIGPLSCVSPSDALSQIQAALTGLPSPYILLDTVVSGQDVVLYTMGLSGARASGIIQPAGTIVGAIFRLTTQSQIGFDLGKGCEGALAWDGVVIRIYRSWNTSTHTGQGEQGRVGPKIILRPNGGSTTTQNWAQYLIPSKKFQTLAEYPPGLETLSSGISPTTPSCFNGRHNIHFQTSGTSSAVLPSDSLSSYDMANLDFLFNPAITSLVLTQNSNYNGPSPLTAAFTAPYLPTTAPPVYTVDAVNHRDYMWWISSAPAGGHTLIKVDLVAIAGGASAATAITAVADPPWAQTGMSTNIYSCWDGGDKIYFIQNIASGLQFAQYSISGNTWVSKAAFPTVTTAPNGVGEICTTRMLYVPAALSGLPEDTIYMVAAASSASIWYRYGVTSNAWTSSIASPATVTIASGSNNIDLNTNPTSISVNLVTGLPTVFPTTIYITTSDNGVQPISITGVSGGNTLTGVTVPSGVHGLMLTGGVVFNGMKNTPDINHTDSNILILDPITGTNGTIYWVNDGRSPESSTPSSLWSFDIGSQTWSSTFSPTFNPGYNVWLDNGAAADTFSMRHFAGKLIMPSSSSSLVITGRADLDGFTLVATFTPPGTGVQIQRFAQFGWPLPLTPTDTFTIGGSVSAGTAVSIPTTQSNTGKINVGDPIELFKPEFTCSPIQPGGTVQVGAGGGGEVTNVSSIPDANHVVAVALANSYAANDTLSEDICPVIGNDQGFFLRLQGDYGYQNDGVGDEYRLCPAEPPYLTALVGRKGVAGLCALELRNTVPGSSTQGRAGSIKGMSVAQATANQGDTDPTSSQPYVAVMPYFWKLQILQDPRGIVIGPMV